MIWIPVVFLVVLLLPALISTLVGVLGLTVWVLALAAEDDDVDRLRRME